MSRILCLFTLFLNLFAIDVARAADIGTGGSKLVVVDTTVANGKSKMVLVSKDPAITKGAGTNAAQISGWVEVAHLGGNGSFDLPLGAGWTANSAEAATYANKTAPAGGSVKSALVKPGSLLKVVGRSLGDGNPLEISAPPPGGTAYATATILNDGEETRLCTQFTDCVHKVVAGGTGYKLTCKRGTADPQCLAAMPPPTTTITSVATNASDAATFAFDADEPASFYCSMDGGAFVPCVSPAAYTGLSAGELHYFEVYGVNPVARVGATVSRSWFSPPADVPPSFSYYELEHTLTLNEISLTAPTPHPAYPGSQPGSRVAYAQPGASLSLSLSGSFSLTAMPAFCPSCVTNFHVGIAGYNIATSGTLCLGNGSTGPVPVSVNNFSFSAPSTPGAYFLNARANWDYQCTDPFFVASADFGPDTVAVLIVEP